MPLCPQITNTPITVTQTSDFVVTSVIPLIAATKDGLATDFNDVQTQAQAAATAAGAAQATANTALANAATAFAAAQASLQPSANTIVNANNQITAINGNGITVYSGSSPTSGARVVLNSAGLAAFNSSNNATFSLSASTGAAVFSGSVTGSTITGGTLNIGGNAIIDGSGLLTATGATITGTINATSGYFGTATNGFSINSTGLVGIGGGTISGGSIVGATFQSASGGFLVTSSGVLTAPTGTLGGFTFGSGVFGDGTNYIGTSGQASFNIYFVRASSGSTGISMQNGGNIAMGGGNITGGGTFTSSTCSTTTVSASGSITATLDVTANRDLFTPNHTTVTDAANGRVTITLGRVTRSTASSQRYKENIVALTDVSELDPKKLLQLPVRAFTYREDYLSESDSRFGALIPGFIAEEVDAVYPVAADYEDGNVESWNDRMIIPGLLALIQDLYHEIDLLKGVAGEQ